MSGGALELRLLGEFTLIRDGMKMPAPTPKKARLLIAYLALSPGHSFLRDDLAYHLWPDGTMEVARFNLRQLLARLRRASPDVSGLIVGNRSTLRLGPVEVVIDVTEFRRQVSSAPEEAVIRWRQSSSIRRTAPIEYWTRRKRRR